MAVASTFCMSDYKTSQRGNGAGRVQSRHNAHRLYPKNMTEFVKQPPDTPKEKCDGKWGHTFYFPTIKQS